MKWITRARPKTDRIACPWLIRRFIDPAAEILYVPKDEVLQMAAQEEALSFDAPGAEYDHRDGKCTFEVLLIDFDLQDDPALARLAHIVHAADIESELHTASRPRPSGHRPRRSRRRSRRPPAPRTSHVRLRRPVRLVSDAGRDIRVTEHLDYDTIRTETVTQVAKLMAGAAITAPKSGGQLFLAGKPNFLETVIVSDAGVRHELAEWLRARGTERRETIWFRDAEVAEAVDAILLVGLADWYPPNYDCGACGFATCAEFLHETRQLRDESDELEFAGPTCNLRDIDLGIAVGSAAKTAAIHSIDCRCQTRVAVAARKLGIIRADVAVALSLSMTHKAIGFDRRMPDIDFDAVTYPPTNTLPLALDTGSRSSRARNRQQPRRRIIPSSTEDPS